MKEFERKFRLRELFLDKNIEDDSLVKNNSTYCPEKGNNKDLDAFFDILWNIDLDQTCDTRNNLTYKQREALNEIKNNENIIIKEADKGSTVVIMNKDYYQKKISEMLKDENNYKSLDNNIDQKILSKIKRFCQTHDKTLTKKEKDFLTKFNCKTSNFYGLPKIHKSKEIKNAIKTQNKEYIEIANPRDLKFRPIIAGPANPTHRISNLVDLLLQPFMRITNSYVKDSTHFLNQLPNHIEPDTQLATFDVTNLYSNIPHELGKEATQYWIRKHPEMLNSRFNEKFILDSLDIILTNNTFQFNNRNYIQVLGTAMGAKMAPAYATLTLAFLEERLYKNIEDRYGHNTKIEFMNSWKRYLDDCFIPWKSSWGHIDNLQTLLQDLHPHIKFTMEIQDNEIPFLDILIIKNGDGKITTDIYRKPTDSLQFLHFRSSHPTACLKAIPYTLARRLCTIISNKHILEMRLDELYHTLRQRGYPPSLINQGIKLASQAPQEDLRNPPPKSKEQPLAFISTHNKNNPDVFPAIYRNTQLLKNNDGLKKLLENTKIINSKRQPHNLKKILTSAYFGSTPQQGTNKCNKSRCELCDILIESKSFKFNNSPKPFKIKRNLNCDSTNVIYVIKCSNCSDEYIGCSKSLRNRTALHKNHIKSDKNRKLFVSKHIFECGKEFKIIPIYQNHNYQTLLIKEKDFISKYMPKLNRTENSQNNNNLNF